MPAVLVAVTRHRFAENRHGIQDRCRQASGRVSDIPARIDSRAEAGPFPLSIQLHVGGRVIADKQVHDDVARELASKFILNAPGVAWPRNEVTACFPIIPPWTGGMLCVLANIRIVCFAH